MPSTVPETDWKIFRELRETALERLCERVLGEVDRFRRDDSRTYHERYIALSHWLEDRDDEIERAFNDPRRSRTLPQLAVILNLGLLRPVELERFSNATRERIESLSSAMAG